MADKKYTLLNSIDYPADLRTLDEHQLVILADELRDYLLDSVSRSGGHFAAGLGVIELTIALHYVFSTPHDRLVWDVGHQCYPHKILTGRRNQIASIRQKGGLAPFPTRCESDYDTFGVGHSSTSIGAALGMALASAQQQNPRKVVSIIGDGGLTAGMAYEALNQLGDTRADVLVIVNDNEMSISHNVGAMSKYLTRIMSSRTWSSMRESSKNLLRPIPPMWEFARRTEEHVKGMFAPGTLFEEMGIRYFGPLDGHDLRTLTKTLRNLKNMSGPRLLHIVTRKGKGYEHAENDPVKYHAVSAFDPAQGVTSKPVNTIDRKTYTQVFSDWVCQMAAADGRLNAITPAMCEGSGLRAFSEQFPTRYFDVGIAEQHALTLAAGMACEGLKPIVAIYSTFLQRGYDQLIHDIAIQKLPVVFAIDRAGLVGPDGQTHAGSFDISFMRCIPNLVLMTPSDECEMQRMLSTAFALDQPAAVRYPRGKANGVKIQAGLEPLPVGKGRIVCVGKHVAVLNFGTLLNQVLEATEVLQSNGIVSATVADMRFVKPLDESLCLELANTHDLLITVEDHCRAGGAGSAVLELLSSEMVMTPIVCIGQPDRFQDHASREELLAEAGLDANGIYQTIKTVFRARDCATPASKVS